MSGPLHTVHVRVNDAVTGQLTPVRIRFSRANQEHLPPDMRDFFAPFGRLTDFPHKSGFNDIGGNVLINEEIYAYIDGTCEVRLPSDPITVAISKGFEYTPLEEQITLGPGKLALRFGVDRWIDLRQQRWYSGDTSVLRLTPHAALLEGAGEDLAVSNLLISELVVLKRDPPCMIIPNIVAFSGQRPALEMPGHLVVVNTTNNAAKLGAVNLLNCHRVVYPLSTGVLPDGLYQWTIADWCDQCHRKGGLVLWTSFCRYCWDEEGAYCSSETLADLILGKVDGVEIDRLDRFEQQPLVNWYMLLNGGFHVPLVGGSNKMWEWEVVGNVRTYGRLQQGEELNYKNWIEAVRSGRTFVTNGPLLILTVDDQDPGATIILSADKRRIRIRAEARSLVPFERLEVIFNGEVVSSTSASGLPSSARIEDEMEVSASGWLAARCWGSPEVATSIASECVAAHTSPFYIHFNGQPMKPDRSALTYFIKMLDKMLVWVNQEALFETDRLREQASDIFLSARQELTRRYSL